MYSGQLQCTDEVFHRRRSLNPTENPNVKSWNFEDFKPTKQRDYTSHHSNATRVFLARSSKQESAKACNEGKMAAQISFVVVCKTGDVFALNVNQNCLVLW